MAMHDFERQVIAILKEHAPVWIVGGAIRDELLGVSSTLIGGPRAWIYLV